MILLIMNHFIWIYAISVFKPGISVLGPKGRYPPKSWGQLKKSGDITIFSFCVWHKANISWYYLSYHIQAMGKIVTTVLESHDLFDYFLFHLFLVCHVRFLPQQLGVKGQIDHLLTGRGLSSLSLVEDSVSPLDRLGKKLNIDRSFAFSHDNVSTILRIRPCAFNTWNTNADWISVSNQKAWYNW